MRKCWVGAAVLLAVGIAATPTWAAVSASDAVKTAAQAACQERSGKKVAITVKVDGETTRYSFTCTKLTATTTTSKPAPYTPVPTDFAISVITLEQSCFGSAGCNITYRIDVQYVGAQTPDPTAKFEVLYTVNGGESPKLNRFTLQAGRLSYPSEENISTDPDPVLTATATQVLKGQ